MAFCPKCGTAIPEDSKEKFCGTCGQPLQENANPETTENKNSVNTEEMLEKGKEIAGEALEKGKAIASNVVETVKNIDVQDVVAKVKAGDKKTIGACAGVVLAIILVFCLIGSLFGGGYMSPINNYMNAINKQSTDYYALISTFKGDKAGKLYQKMIDAYVDADAELYDDYTYEDQVESYADRLEDIYDDIEDEFGGAAKIKFEKKSAEKVDKDDLEDYAEDLNDYYEDLVDDLEDTLDDDDEIEEFADDYNIKEADAKKILNARLNYYKFFVDCKVSEAYEVKGKFIITADGDDYETDTVKLIIAKVNGSWMYLGCEDYISLDTDDEEAEYFENIIYFINYGGAL